MQPVIPINVPTQDNVVFWFLALLVVAIGVLFKIMHSEMKASKKDCKDELERINNKFDNYAKEVFDVTIKEFRENSAQREVTNSLIKQNIEILQNHFKQNN